MRIDFIDIKLNDCNVIYKQLYSFIKGKIITGEYSQGDVLPSSRKLATVMNISRTSVVNAYNLLIAEGYVSAIAGSGHVINALPIAKYECRKNKTMNKVRSRRFLPFNPEPVDLSLTASRRWAMTTSKIGRENAVNIFSLYQNEKFGYIGLRESISKYLYELKGIECVPEQIFITSGTMESIELCVNLLTSSKSSLGIEDPCYPPILHFFSRSNRKLNFMHIDQNGANPNSLSSECKAAIITPGSQFPLGITMSTKRKINFIEWAEKNDGWIFEDSYDSELNDYGKREKTIFSMDRNGRTIYFGGFSRVLISELRVGYFILPISLISTFSNIEYSSKVSSLPQIILSEFINSGEFYQNLVKIKKICRKKKKYFVMLLNECLSNYGQAYDNRSGSFVVFVLKRSLPDNIISLYAKEKGIDLRAISTMSHNSGVNGWLMGFIYLSIDILRKSVFILKDILSTYCTMHNIDQENTKL